MQVNGHAKDNMTPRILQTIEQDEMLIFFYFW